MEKTIKYISSILLTVFLIAGVVYSVKDITSLSDDYAVDGDTLTASWINEVKDKFIEIDKWPMYTVIKDTKSYTQSKNVQCPAGHIAINAMVTNPSTNEPMYWSERVHTEFCEFRWNVMSQMTRLETYPSTNEKLNCFCLKANRYGDN